MPWSICSPVRYVPSGVPSIETTKRTFKVAMIAACPFPTSQGSQVLIKGVSLALLRRGHRVHVIAYHHSESAWGQGLTVHRIPTIPTYRKYRAGPAFQKPLLDLLLALRTLQVVNREGIDLLHAHNYEGLAAGILVRRATGKPLVYHAHNVLSHELHTYFRARKARRAARIAARFIDRRLPLRADHCIALCSEIAQALRSCGVPDSSCSVIPPGLFPEEFDSPHPLRAAAEGMSRPDPPRSRPPTVIYTGNLDDYQDLDLLLSAFRQVIETIPEALLLIVSNSDPAPIRAEAARHRIGHRCVFVKPENFREVLGLLSRSDAAVSTRTGSTGFPIKLLNYLGAGLPVVASAGSAKGVTHMENGYVVANGDKEAFAEGIIALLRDTKLAGKLGRQAGRLVRKRYDYAVLAERIEEIYSRLIAEDLRREG